MSEFEKSGKEEEPSEVEDEDENLYSLFISEDYVEKSWYFRHIPEQKLLCSNMSSTDHDLTGQIVWPASIILSWFIDTNHLLFSKRRLVELGAGCGLAGFLAANFAEQVLLTDGNDIVCKLLKQNQEYLKLPNVEVFKLLWGMNKELEKVKEAISRSKQTTQGLCFPDYIIGADIILWPDQIKSLLSTIRWLLFGRHYQSLDTTTTKSTDTPEESTQFSPKAFISYVIRANSTTDLFFKVAAELGLVVDIVPREHFIPEDIKQFDRLETRLFTIQLSDETIAKGCDLEREEIPEIQNDINLRYMPC